MRSEPRRTVAANLRAEIAAQRRRQADLMEVWGMSEMGVSRRMTGRTPITTEQLIAAAAWLGVDAADLLPNQVAAS